MDTSSVLTQLQRRFLQAGYDFKRSTAKVTLLVILKPFAGRCDDIAEGL